MDCGAAPSSRIRHHIFRAGTGRQREIHHAINSIARRPLTDTIAQGVHHAADIITGHKMKTLAEGLGHKTQSTAGFEIDGIHTATGHPDPDLSGARLGNGRVFKLQNLGAAEAGIEDAAHGQISVQYSGPTA